MVGYTRVHQALASSVDVMFLAVVGSGVSYPTSFVQDGASEQRRRAKAW